MCRASDRRGTTRQLPAGSLPDIGAVEINQPLSTGATANNDVRSGTDAMNNLTGLIGNDLLRGLGGNDALEGGASSDLLNGEIQLTGIKALKEADFRS